MPHGHIVLAHIHVGVGVGAGDGVHQQRVTDHGRLGVLSALTNLNQAAVCATAAVTCHGLGHNGRGGIRCNVNHLRAGVLVLALARECDG